MSIQPKHAPIRNYVHITCDHPPPPPLAGRNKGRQRQQLALVEFGAQRVMALQDPRLQTPHICEFFQCQDPPEPRGRLCLLPAALLLSSVRRALGCYYICHATTAQPHRLRSYRSRMYMYGAELFFPWRLLLRAW